MTGDLHPDGKTGALVKPGARFAFRMLSPDRMVVEFSRLRAGGQVPTAFYCVLERKR